MDIKTFFDFIYRVFNLKKSDIISIPVVSVSFGADAPFVGTTLSLVRKTMSQFSTQGELFINSKFFSYTIELPKVPYGGSSVCTPLGTFAVKLYHSPHWDFNVPELQNVPGRTHIQIHPANWAINPTTKKAYLLGCIALGDSKEKDVVYHSGDTFRLLMSTVDWKKPVRIIISEAFSL